MKIPDPPARYAENVRAVEQRKHRGLWPLGLDIDLRPQFLRLKRGLFAAHTKGDL